MANANEHDHAPVPMIITGGMCGQLKGNRHIRCAPNSPHSNLLLSVINKAGVPMETFGDSTEPVSI
jgi:hypothetical protein